jgi:hypothetical protein
MIIPTLVALLLSSVQEAAAINIRQISNGIATVNISSTFGEAKSLASGFIYGFPDNGTQVDLSISENFVRDIKFHSTRAGGAQIPARGWVASLEDYIGRFNSTLSNYSCTTFGVRTAEVSRSSPEMMATGLWQMHFCSDLLTIFGRTTCSMASS